MWSMCWWVMRISSRSSIDAAVARELALELVERRARVRPRVDQRERVVLDQVDVDAPDGERRGDRQPVDPLLGSRGVGVRRTRPRTLPVASNPPEIRGNLPKPGRVSCLRHGSRSCPLRPRRRRARRHHRHRRRVDHDPAADPRAGHEAGRRHRHRPGLRRDHEDGRRLAPPAQGHGQPGHLRLAGGRQRAGRARRRRRAALAARRAGATASTTSCCGRSRAR